MRKCAKIAEYHVFDHEMQGAFGINQQSTGWKKKIRTCICIISKQCSLTIYSKSSHLSLNRLVRVSSIIQAILCLWILLKFWRFIYRMWRSIASGKHLLGACCAGVKVKYLLFFSYHGGDGRGIRTAQMARLRILRQSRLPHTIKPCGDGWITEIRCKNIF